MLCRGILFSASHLRPIICVADTDLAVSDSEPGWWSGGLLTHSAGSHLSYKANKGPGTRNWAPIS